MGRIVVAVSCQVIPQPIVPHGDTVADLFPQVMAIRAMGIADLAQLTLTGHTGGRQLVLAVAAVPHAGVPQQADAAVAAGMPRAQAYEFAAQAVLGSAKMVLETGKHPGELKDMVCSPGGTTIDAVKVLEQRGFRAAVMDAMEACVEKSKNL